MSGDEYGPVRASGIGHCTRPGSSGCPGPASIGGQELPPVYDVILDEELARARARRRARASATSSQGLGRHGSAELRQRFLPGMIDGTERWCQGFSEPGAGRTWRPDAHRRAATATTGSSRAQDLDQLLRCRQLVSAAGPHRPRRAAAQGHLRRSCSRCSSRACSSARCTMMSGVSTEFGQVLFDGATVPADQMVGAPGEGWKLAMTVVGHEREPVHAGIHAPATAKIVTKLAAAAQAATAGPAELALGAVQPRCSTARPAAAVRAARRRGHGSTAPWTSC